MNKIKCEMEIGELIKLMKEVGGDNKEMLFVDGEKLLIEKILTGILTGNNIKDINKVDKISIELIN